jgi:NTE family protein
LLHLGSLWRLNELGLLKRVRIITSVSGGSIIAGALAATWDTLNFILPNGTKTDVAQDFQEKLVTPMWDFCNRNLDVRSFLKGVFSFGKSRADELAEQYESLTHGKKLEDLPEDNVGPRFVFYATSLQTGSSVRFQKKRIADYRVGEIPNPKNFPLSMAVAASSAFPPVFSPVALKFNPGDWKAFPGADLFGNDKLKSQVILADGGVYDNMGLEAIWQRCKIVLVSDAGAPLGIDESPGITDQMGRVRDILIEQTRTLRKRALIADFRAKRLEGTYWGITTHIKDYQLQDPMTMDSPATERLQTIATRLAAFPELDRGQLVNWGYALADAALRKHVRQILPAGAAKPLQWPFANYPL